MIQNQLLINKRQIRFFKYILMSPILEQVSLITYVLLFFFILVFFVTHNFNTNPSSFLHKNYALKNYQFFQNNVSIPRFFDYLTNEFPTTYINSTNSIYTLFGSIRITQYRLIRDLDCFDVSSLKRYSIDCNRFFESDWTNYLRNTIDFPSNEDQCIEDKCLEFSTRYLDFVVRKTNWQTYPQRAFYLTIPLDNYNMTLNKLSTNGWFSENETVAILIEFNNIDLRYLNLFPTLIYLEMPNFSDTKVTIHMKNIMVRSNEDFLYVFIVPMYLLIVALLTVKGIFEFSYYSNKITCILNLITYTSNLVHAICLLLENAQYRRIFPTDLTTELESFFDPDNRNIYYPLNMIVFYRNIIDILMFLCLISYPFKFFELISWFKAFGFIEKFINSIYRTLIGFTRYFISFIIVSIFWTLGLYIFLRDYEFDFETFFQSFLSFLFSKTNLNDAKSHMEILSMEMIILFIKGSRILFLGYFIGIIIFCIYRATSIDYSQFYVNNDKEINDNLLSISVKIDKFVLKHLPNLQQNHSSKSMQMMVWLTNSELPSFIENEIIEICKVKEIKLLIFFEVKQIIQFMNDLFKLKPNLAFRSENFFRIMVEISKENPELDHKHHIILKWLQDYGSRVPVLLYVSEIDEPEMMKSIVQRMYKYVYLTGNTEEVKEFMIFKKMSEIKFNKDPIVNKVNTISEMDSSMFSHSFDLEYYNYE